MIELKTPKWIVGFYYKYALHDSFIVYFPLMDNPNKINIEFVMFTEKCKVRE